MELSQDNVRQFLEGIDVFLFDCDGVLYRGKDTIKGATETIHFLRSIGKKTLFVTNNSSKTREQ